MYRTNAVFFLVLLSMLNISMEVEYNSSMTTTLSMLASQDHSVSCTYCQTMACRCSSEQKVLNCSSYLLNLTSASDCADLMIWETVDFSLRNLEFLDSSRLLSLRMNRLLLKSSLITNIHDNTFDSIADILIELDLQMNQLPTVSSKWLHSKFTRLKILNLASNQLESFTHLDNVLLPSLQELNLSCNQIELFPSQIHQWTSLIKLDLSFNKLSSVPRFALMDLHDLAWLSLASNRNLRCIIQDSFKYLKSLKYLDLSSTNLVDLDGCIFIQLTNLRILKIERVSMNCTSCWLPIAKKNSIELFGQCLNNRTIQRLDSLTNQQLHNSCSKSSIDCSLDYCEPDALPFQSKSLSSDKSSLSPKSSDTSNNRTITIVLSVIFSIIALITIITVAILIYRWKQGKTLLCCDFLSRKNQATRRHKGIIDHNSPVIESVVTHGANMNIPSYSHQNNAYSNEITSNNKRKLYNPMFTDSPSSDISHHQANDSSSHINNRLYSENM